MSCRSVFARQLVGVSHINVVEWAVTDVPLECPREIPHVVHRHHQTLIVEEVIQAPPLQVQHLAHEPVHQVRAWERLVLFVGEYCCVRHKLVPDRTGNVVQVELRLAPLLILWRTQCHAVRVDQHRHSLFESHVHQLDCCSRLRQSLDGGLEIWTVAKHLLPLQGILSDKVPKAPSAKTFLQFDFDDVGEEPLETGYECSGLPSRAGRRSSPYACPIRTGGIVLSPRRRRCLRSKCSSSGGPLTQALGLAERGIGSGPATDRERSCRIVLADCGSLCGALVTRRYCSQSTDCLCF